MPFRSSGTISWSRDRPIASSGVKPKSISAPLFQERTFPSNDTANKASGCHEHFSGRPSGEPRLLIIASSLGCGGAASPVAPVPPSRLGEWRPKNI